MRKGKLLQHYITAAAIALAACTGIHATAQDYFSRIGTEGVKLYAAVTFGAINDYDAIAPGIYDLDHEAQYNPLAQESPRLPGYIAGGVTYHEGKIYCNFYDDSSNTQAVKPIWRVYDAETMELLSENTLKDNCENTTISLAYDATTDKIYGLVKDYTDTHLVEINPENGEMTRIGDNFARANKYLSLACNSRGQLYCIYIENDVTVLGKIRKSDGRIVKVHDIIAENLLSEEDMLINMGYKQCMFFDNAQDKLYWIFGSSSAFLRSEYTAITEVNTASATARLVAYLDKLYHISGAYLQEPDPAVPHIITDFAFVPEATGATSGTFSMGMPTVCYNGEELSGGLHVTATENDVTLFTLEGVAAGSQAESPVVTLTRGMHRVTVTVSNEAGDGPAVERTFYVGYDTPKAPQNIVMTNNGWYETTLTWTPPTEGVNGAPINSENLTYRVVRYPNEVTVAEGLADCTFTETHPEEMTRYIYMVYALDGEVTGEGGHSNSMILGTPLNVPYGGIFTEPADMFNYYTIIDSNADAFSWTYDMTTASAVYIYNPLQPADDWLMAPPINYESGKTYKLSFKAYSSLAGYLEAMEVRMGNERTPEAQDILLLDIPEIPAVDAEHPVTEYSTTFTVEEDGIYYYSFHAVSPKFHEYLYLFDIRVTDDATGGVLSPATDAMKVTAGKGYIRIDNPEHSRIYVYNSSGILVNCAEGSSIRCDVPAGLYIVHNGTVSHKVMVY